MQRIKLRNYERVKPMASNICMIMLQIACMILDGFKLLIILKPKIHKIEFY